jgi:hypothetical protein
MLEKAAKCRDELRRMGMDALKVARTMTHQLMHRKRRRLLLQLLHEGSGPAGRDGSHRAA